MQLGGAGADSVTLPLTLNNIGDRDVTLSDVSIEGDEGGAFRLASLVPEGTKVLAHGDLTLMVAFQPQDSGEPSAMLRIEHDGEGGFAEVNLTGLAVSTNADIKVTVPQNNLGGAIVGGPVLQLAKFVTIENRGKQPLRISEIKLSPGRGAGQFSLSGAPLTGLVLQPKEAVNFDLSFRPAKAGLERAEIQIHSNDPATPVYKLQLTATGMSADPRASLDYGNDFVAIESPDFPNGPVLRAKSDDNGDFQFFLPPGQRYHAVIFDPVSGLAAHLNGITSSSGQNNPTGHPGLFAKHRSGLGRRWIARRH